MLVGIALAILVGTIMGLIGAGGSILTVPILVYVVRLDAVTATAYSLFVVGVTSVFGAATYWRRYAAAGGGMGVVLDRPRFVQSISAELDRRLLAANLDQASSAAARADLGAARLIPDDGDLLQLVMGYRRCADLDAAQLGAGGAAARAAWAWFPGGGTPVLPLPFAHQLDHY